MGRQGLAVRVEPDGDGLEDDGGRVVADEEVGVGVPVLGGTDPEQVGVVAAP